MRSVTLSTSAKKADNRPYWQRQSRSVDGWAAHRRAVQEWKSRNPEAAQLHCKRQYHKRKKEYGGETHRSDIAAINKAALQNLHLIKSGIL